MARLFVLGAGVQILEVFNVPQAIKEALLLPKNVDRVSWEQVLTAFNKSRIQFVVNRLRRAFETFHH